MSKRRVVITAVLAGQSQSEVARAYGVSQGWVSKLMARYRDEGEAAFAPRSRAPLTTPSATPATTVELIVRLRKQLLEAGLDAGAETIGWHLEHRHHITVSRATINRGPGPPRRGDPGPLEATTLVLHPLRSLDAERDLAVRLHPLPARHRRRCRDHHLARRPLQVPAARLSPPPGSPARSWSPPSPSDRCHARLSRLDADRQRHGLHDPVLQRTGRRTTQPQRVRVRCCATSTSSRRTPVPTTPPPAARSNASSRPSRSGYEPNPTSPPP